MKVIAFYLPQFHTIPENDLWWGKGFTEWTNTRRAVPGYPGHYQPHIPLNKHYYDLVLEPDTMRRQMEQAKHYGVDAFCYYHYWFANGKKLLEKPVEQMLRDKTLDMPFCLCWANENWSRRWDGSAHEILMAQDYGSRQDMLDHFDYLKLFFADSRYLRDDAGRPIMLIYKPGLIANLEEMMRCWNDLAVKSGLRGICFVCQYPQFGDPIEEKFDYCVEFEPIATTGNVAARPVAALKASAAAAAEVVMTKLLQICGIRSYKKYSYKRTVKASIARPVGSRTLLGAFTGWDNTARRGRNAIIYHNSTPEMFEHYVTEQLKKSIAAGQEGILFINAWNEWAEGAHLEPDEKHGFAYLEALLRARQNVQREIAGGE